MTQCLETQSLKTSLNPDQLEAVEYTDGPLLILAGAGSGKTTVLVLRTQHILELKKAKPEEVVVLTFTNKAARELKGRVSEVVPNGKKLVTGTFHAFGLNFFKKTSQTSRSSHALWGY